MRDKVLAIDFDGTLCTHNYPYIGEPNTKLIERLKKEKEYGTKLILWTCREGKHLAEAAHWCEEKGLYFDAINDNLYEHILEFGGNSRKICADYYIDDKCLKIKDYLKGVLYNEC